MHPVPRISIGMPVYNGSNFLAKAIESILSQSFEDFELIISDNASLDDTQAICQRYAATDSRIAYSRNESNIGAAKNFNRTFALARGEYFKWASHDDLLDRHFLAKCLAALQDQPEAVLAYADVVLIDESAKLKPALKRRLPNASSQRAEERFRDLASDRHLCYEVFGLMRASALRRTPLIGAYVTSDRNLLAELSLIGPFTEVPEPLLMIRDHKTRSVSKPRHDRLGWFDPALENNLAFPYWREFAEYAKSVRRVPLSTPVKLSCWGHTMYWLLQHWRFLRGDLRIAATRAVTRPWVRANAGRRANGVSEN